MAGSRARSNVAPGLPTLVASLRGIVLLDIRVSALRSAKHSGLFGGPAPDPIAGLVALLATLHDAQGNATVDGVPHDQTWPGMQLPEDEFRRDATVLDGVGLMGRCGRGRR
jgi:cysteinylglycine-S-conjugate dipeptidase